MNMDKKMRSNKKKSSKGPVKTQKQIHDDFFSSEKASNSLKLSNAESDNVGNNVKEQEILEKRSNSSDDVLNNSAEMLKMNYAGPELPGRVGRIEESSTEFKDGLLNNKNSEDHTRVSQKEKRIEEKISNSRDDTIDEEKSDGLKNEINGITGEKNKQSEFNSERFKISSEKINLMTNEILLTDIYKCFVEDIRSVPHGRKQIDVIRTYFGDNIPLSLMDIVVGECFEGDSEISVDLKPDWLDLEKFRKGQKFALDYQFGVNYSNLLALFTVFSFKDDLKPLIFTQASNTPYTAFKRYASTNRRIYHWYSSDPWTPGTKAYNDIKTVRKVHAQVRKNLANTSNEEFVSRTTINDPWCPALEITRRDFESTCQAPEPGQCPYMIFENCPNLKLHKLNQGEMIATQFAFVGLFILKPKFFGAHDATDEDLEAFCHVWRGIGYLLGIDDRFNFCRGSLEDVKTRSRDFLESWVKPNLRTVTPEWEHMMRCVIEGLQYYFPGSTYEMCLLDLAEMMNLQMPLLYDSMSYFVWIRHGIMRFTFNHLCKLAKFRESFNRILIAAQKRMTNFDEKKHKELQERSARTLNSCKQKCD